MLGLLVQHICCMNSQIKKSILLPGGFFEDEWKNKIALIRDLNELHSIYFYDHDINPANKSYQSYSQFEAIRKVLNYEQNLRLGTLVTNISKQHTESLFSSLDEILSNTLKFDFGIGLGDDLYEKSPKRKPEYIESTIKKILKKYNFDKDSKSIFIGGFSNKVKSLAIKYELGVNLWKKDQRYISKISQLPFRDDFKGRFSIALDHNLVNTIGYSKSSKLEEVIFILKDSSLNKFSEQLDNIELRR